MPSMPNIGAGALVSAGHEPIKLDRADPNSTNEDTGTLDVDGLKLGLRLVPDLRLANPPSSATNDCTLEVAKPLKAMASWIASVGTEMEKVTYTVKPKSKEFSNHQRWQAFVTFLRQPGNSMVFYDSFRECQCCPYTGKCPRPLLMQLDRLFFRLRFLENDPVEAIPKHILASETSKAAEVARGMANSVFFHYARLQQFVARYEEVIQKTWDRKSRKQRQAILRSAADLDTGGMWSSKNLPSNHRPECESSINDCSLMPENPMKHPTYAVPHINTQDLIEDNNLLMFLKSRGRELPGVFVHQDFQNCGVVTRQLQGKRFSRNGYISLKGCRNCPDPIFGEIPGLFMSFAGKSDPGEYAKLLSWDQAEMTDWLPVDQGQHILLIQSFTYSFLDRVCMFMLRDFWPDVLSQPWTTADELFCQCSQEVQPEPSIPPCLEDRDFSSISKILKTAAYKVPTRLDMGHVQSLISARASRARDHLWDLRADPGYFREALVNESNHSPLRIRGHDNCYSPDISNAKGSEFFWASVIENVLRSGFLEFAMWNMFSSRVGKVQSAYARTGGFTPGMEQSHMQQLYTLLCELNGFIILMEDYASKELFLSSIPCFDHMWTLHEHIGQCTDYPIDLNLKRSPRQFADLFARLGLQPARKRHAADFVLADYAQGLLENNPTESEKVTPHLRSRFNDWAIVQEVDRQIQSLHPWARSIQQDTPSYSDLLTEDLTVLNRFNRCAFGAAQILAERNLLREGKFAYPSDRPRTRERVFTMQASERELGKFWQTFDRYCATFFEPVNSMLGIDFLDQIVPLRTEAWEDVPVGESASPADVDYAENLRELELRTQQNLNISDAQSVRNKFKTRGIADRAQANVRGQVEAEDMKPADTPGTATIKLGKKAFKTLTSLFFSSEQHLQQSKEIAWSEFLYAMAAADFNVQKLWGSIWHFSPRDQALGRSIQFHDPHPSMKLDVAKARRIGRRLNRAYGWTIDTFARKEAVDSSAQRGDTTHANK